jgi:hypothetical protein
MVTEPATTQARIRGSSVNEPTVVDARKGNLTIRQGVRRATTRLYPDPDYRSHLSQFVGGLPTAWLSGKHEAVNV